MATMRHTGLRRMGRRTVHTIKRETKLLYLKIAAAVAGFVLSVKAAYSLTLCGGGPAEAWVNGQIAILAVAVNTALGSMLASLSEVIIDQFESIISAIAVTTKQEGVSAHVVSDGLFVTGSQAVNAASASKQGSVVANAVLEYSPTTGYGYDPCGTNLKNKTLDGAFIKASETANTLTAQNVGKLENSRSTAINDRLKKHREKFCTESEANAGLCSVSELPGGDTNASLLFESAKEESLTGEARMAYVQHILGEPDQLLPAAAGKNPAGRSYMVLKNRKDALLSVPAYSLNTIIANNTQTDELQGQSPNDVLRKRVDQYFGGDEAQKWSGNLAFQTERGLLQETARLHGLGAWLAYRRFEQNQRIEANLATLVLTVAEQSKAQSNREYERVMDEATGSIVK